MLIDPNPIRVVPMIGTPTITHRIRCSSNVACPAAPNNKMHKKISPWICGETYSQPDDQKAKQEFM